MKLPKISLAQFLVGWMFLSTATMLGCSTIPAIDTLNKRIVVAEATYSVVMDKVRVYVGEDRFSKEQLQNILPKVYEIRRALESLQAAKELKDDIMAGNQIQTINRILQTFRDYLAQADKVVLLEKDTSIGYEDLQLTTFANLHIGIMTGASL